MQHGPLAPVVQQQLQHPPRQRWVGVSTASYALITCSCPKPRSAWICGTGGRCTHGIQHGGLGAGCIGGMQGMASAEPDGAQESEAHEPAVRHAAAPRHPFQQTYRELAQDVRLQHLRQRPLDEFDCHVTSIFDVFEVPGVSGAALTCKRRQQARSCVKERVNRRRRYGAPATQQRAPGRGQRLLPRPRPSQLLHSPRCLTAL